jgi:DNA-binding transcriptional ArsR family regulator
MKAFAHPLRMAMYEYLNDHGSATATMLARHTGESTGQTSYHLRQLERHGFVEEDPDRGTGRERWWKAVGFRLEGPELAKDSSTRPAVEAMLRTQVARRAEVLREWFARSEQEPARWQEGSISTRSTVPMTPDEAADLVRALMETIHEHAEQARARREQEEQGSATSASAAPAEGASDSAGDVRRVRLYLDVLPLPQDG